MNNGIKKRALGVFLFFGFLAFIAICLMLESYLGIGYVCPIYKATGLSCPGCGGTRMLLALFDFDIVQAFRYNAFLTVTLPPLAILSIYQTYLFVFKGNFSVWLDKVLIAYMITTLSFGIVRNIGIFCWLQPTKI